jgi:hypothetical protein
MKAKLGELQARLESHEAQKTQTKDDKIGQAVNATTPNSFTTQTQSDPLDASTSPGGDMHQQQSIPHLLPQHGLFDPTVVKEDPSLFQQDTTYGLLNSPPHSQPSPTAPGLLSPPTQADSHDPRSGKNSHDFMMDCLRFQSQLLTRLNSLQQETGFPGGFPASSKSRQCRR